MFKCLRKGFVDAIACIYFKYPGAATGGFQFPWVEVVYFPDEACSPCVGHLPSEESQCGSGPGSEHDSDDH